MSAVPASYPCPHCGAPGAVVFTIYVPAKGLKRHRRCRAGHRFTTMESTPARIGTNHELTTTPRLRLHRGRRFA